MLCLVAVWGRVDPRVQMGPHRHAENVDSHFHPLNGQGMSLGLGGD